MEFLLLGPVEVRSAHDRLTVSSLRQRTVLATLLLARGAVVAPYRLVQMVWGDAAPKSAEANLRTYVSQLRRRLAGIEGSRQRIVATSGGYRIDVLPAEVDLELFEQCTQTGQEALHAGEDDRAVALFDRGLALWRGQPLANLAWTPAVDAEAQRLIEVRLWAVETCARARLRLGLHAEVIGDLRRLVAEYPLHERLWALLVSALGGTGQQAAALTAYETIRRQLAEDLGAEPGLELRRAQLGVLRQDGAPPSEQVPVPAQLPRPVSGFCGRSAELRALDQLGHRADSPRLAAIVGSPGVGKTALVTHWAHRMSFRFPDGQLYADLHAEDNTTLILARFLRALGVPLPRVPHDLGEAAALYRTILFGRSVLCVLDNADEVGRVRPLLPAGPRSMALVVSRDRHDEFVALDGARRISVDVLPEADAVTLLTDMLGAERSRAEPEAVRGLAAACARLPLALRITGAQLAHRAGRTAADHLAALNKRGVLNMLTVDGGATSALRAAYDLCYTALDIPTRRTFRLLGLIPGRTFTAEAAAALTASPLWIVESQLDRLANAHLIHEVSPHRYGFHDLIRRYAAERHDIEETDSERATRTADLLRHYVLRADAATARLYPVVARMPRERDDRITFSTDDSAREWLRAERTNLGAAIHHAHGAGMHTLTWQLMDAFRGHCYFSQLPEATALAQLALEAAESAANTAAQAAAHNGLAGAYFVHTQFEQARAHYNAALALHRSIGSRRGEIVALENLFALHTFAGDLPRAAATLSEAGLLQSQHKYTNQLHLGIFYEYRGQLADAIAILTQAAAERPTPESLCLLARVAIRGGDHESAQPAAHQALDIARSVGDRCSEAHALTLLTHVDPDNGEPSRALVAAETALNLALEVADPLTEMAARTALALASRAVGDSVRALGQYRQCLRVAQRTGTRFEQCEALLGMARAYGDIGDDDGTQRSLAAAEALARDYGYQGLATDIRSLAGSTDRS
ncbi:AfsR/SARP family transcriptional regulator [Saccharothrix sp. AJ9571]|nr:AfsR/SARP family transcriptional regulator [Saccharothrix sp. AJ9571]